jgi:hypothetical protein
LAAGRAHDGWYAAFLVEVDSDGRFDPYHSLDDEETVWCHETEYVARA